MQQSNNLKTGDCTNAQEYAMYTIILQYKVKYKVELVKHFLTS